jgi:sugar phosphate isomerase/epimerase
VRHEIRLAVQEQYLQGDTMIAKWEHAQRLGFDAIELRGAGDLAFEARLSDLKAAAAAGVPMPTACVEMLHFVGDFNADKRADALRQLTSQLSVMAEIGGRLAMTPASYGMFSTRLPPFVSPRSEAEDHDILVEAFGQLAKHAEREGVVIALEPLNRYENHMINTLAQAKALCEEVGSAHFGIAADTYHMNIEESDPYAILGLAGPHIKHVQVSGTDRGAPGRDHFDWPRFLTALRATGYGGAVCVEAFTALNETIATAASIWRPLAPSQDRLALDGLTYLRTVNRRLDRQSSLDGDETSH